MRQDMTTKAVRTLAAVGLVLSATAIPAVADDTGMASIHDLRRERGRLCMSDHWHSGSGSGRDQKAAMRDAVGSWASFTALEYGSVWASWGRAAGKGASCSKDSGGYSCSISARPCR